MKGLYILTVFTAVVGLGGPASSDLLDDAGNALSSGADAVTGGAEDLANGARDLGDAAAQGIRQGIEDINPVNQARRFGALIEAVGSGDDRKIKAALGDVILHSGSCANCENMANTIIPQLSPEQIHAITGEGVIVLYTTGDPYLVFVDVARNIYQEVRMVKDEDAPTPFAQAPQAPQSSERQPAHFTGSPECISRQGENIFAIWKTQGTLTSNGTSSTFPTISIQEGDIVSVTAVGECTDNVKQAQGSEVLQSATISYVGNNSAEVASPDALKFWIYGPEP